MRLQSLYREPNTSENAIQFPLFFLKVGKEKVSADDKNYINILQYIGRCTVAKSGAISSSKT